MSEFILERKVTMLEQFIGATFPIAELTEAQMIGAKDLALKIYKRQSARSLSQVTYHTVEGYKAQFGFIAFLRKNGIIVCEPGADDWWWDFALKDNGRVVYFDHKACLGGSSYSRTPNEVEYLKKHPELEVFYACSNLRLKPGFGIYKGVISSKSQGWKDNRDGNGSKYIFENELKLG